MLKDYHVIMPKNKFKKEVVILSHNRGQLANQLHNYVAVYAYCLDRGFECSNPSFFEYYHYFSFAYPKNIFLKALNIFSRNKIFPRKILYFLYSFYRFFISKKQSKILSIDKKEELPPSAISSVIKDFEEGSEEKLLLNGWPYSNSVGKEKYYEEIRKAFKPKERFCLNPEKVIQDSRKLKENIVGIHIRRGDYKYYENGEFYLTDEDVKSFLEDLREMYSPVNTRLIICCDEQIQPGIFSPYDVFVSDFTPIEDLYLLSLSDVIFGSRSTFGTFAAYYGNIDHHEIK